MRLTLQTRGISALIMLAISSQALVFVPVLHHLAAAFWGLSLAFLVGALVLAVRRDRVRRRE